LGYTRTDRPPGGGNGAKENLCLSKKKLVLSLIKIMPKCLRVSSLVGFARLMLKLNKGSVRRLQFTDAGASLETGGGVITSNIGEGK
jgi:hypothetical protein